MGQIKKFHIELDMGPLSPCKIYDCNTVRAALADGGLKNVNITEIVVGPRDSSSCHSASSYPLRERECCGTCSKGCHNDYASGCCYYEPRKLFLYYVGDGKHKR